MRVYLDKQIFSYLRTNPDYAKLLSALNTYKDSFLYCYSHAHLLDLKNGTRRDKTYEDLDFMETLVGDNYISYHATTKHTSYYLARPREAFSSIDIEDEPLDFDSLFDLDLSFAIDEQKEIYTKSIEALTTQKIDLGFSQLKNAPDEISAALSKILPADMPQMTILEWTKHFMNIVKTLDEDKTVYKGLRNVVDKGINNGKYTVEYDNIDFNDSLKNSALQKSFVDYVNGNLNPNGDKEFTDYDFFTNAYLSLDLLGISKEPSGKVKFRNVLNDGIHGYYGTYCDYVVSNDDGFLKKTKAMYKLLGIETNVLHLDEFIQNIHLIGNTKEQDFKTFLDLLINDLQNGMVLGSRPSFRFDRQTTTIKTVHNYLSFFNKIENIIERGNNFIVLTRETKNYSNNTFFYREIEAVVNRAIKLFGIDYDFKGEYNWQDENEQINNRKWDGRLWKIGELTILIELNKGTELLTLLITTIPNNPDSRKIIVPNIGNK